ncbi:MAG: sugar-binding protein [Okeania sp. SIO3I5]|uniref:SpvB/TcaC N-terminal domain-containing protein n=1 Tax=Okeania sp. SIO3I5 TaxID=2607805 RepID=UPI0013B9456C|nr:SpvB/TcaC N-terminal domain-containing protein [Okeania sp. SIO3I5]NEQ34877.1 sugar-binding protein [Okeania sp. SIO3I5]
MNSNSATSKQITATQVSLPKGGGAITGIGETFQPDEFTGTAGVSIPISTTPCRGFEPQLSVSYNSGNGNGIFGLGFALSIPKISRKTSKGLPKYDGTDTFILSNADDLVPIGSRTEGSYHIIAYRPRTEGLFAKIEQWTDNSTGESYWQVTSKDNITSIFGKTPQARISDPENADRIFEWLLEESFDARGNYIIYRYKEENTEGVPKAIYEENRTQTANKYIEKIQYGNDQPLKEGDDFSSVIWHFEVIFDYGEYDINPTKTTPYTPVKEWANRQDPFSTYHAGFEIRTYRLCSNVLMFHRFAELGSEPILVHATRFNYQEDPNITFLTSVEAIGYRYENGQYQTKNLPPLEFKYTKFKPEGHKFELFLEEDDRFLPGLISSGYQILDLYGEGIPGVLYNDGSTTLYWEAAANGEGSKAVKYNPSQQPQSLPLPYGKTNNQQLIDLTGNGKLDLVLSTPNVSGYYEVKSDRSWQGFQTFPAFTNEFLDPDSKLTDITGDGLLDLLRMEGDRVKVYPGKGKEGFGLPLIQHPENDLPLEKKGDRTEALRFADIFGTGRQHLVRIGNGLVECWPSLGYGKFGKKVTLGNAPKFGADFDVSRLFLADIDGSGTADILYVKSDRIMVWFNQSGNAFSRPITVYLPSQWDNLDQISFADVLGNGTTCMVLSESHSQPRHWCYDFCQRTKPHLLNQTDNNLGATTRITYGTSTKYYLEDKEKGRPWITNLPFPVQVVAQTETQDLISKTTLVAKYSYHHGYYDGEEREFRGFGMVERQDAETLPADDDKQPWPVVTKTWYHTGAWLEGTELSQQYKKEYFAGDPEAYSFPDSVFDYQDYQQKHPNYQPDSEAWRSACRALKGTVLRSEVYALERQQNSYQLTEPYTITETNYSVRLLQPQGKNKYGVYFVHDLETLTYHYERNPLDPRIQHEFVLEVTDFGNVKKACTVVYGRRQNQSIHIYPEQTALKATVQLGEFIEQTTAFRLIGIPYEQKSWEINNLNLQGTGYFTLAEIRQQINEALTNKIAYGEEFSGQAPQARLFSWERSYFWNEALHNVLPLGQITAQALLHHHQQAVFPKGWGLEVHNNQVDISKIVRDEGGYFLEDDYWWNKGLVQHYSDKFYLPCKTENDFAKTASQGDGLRAKTMVSYDKYYLVPVQTELYITDTEKNVMRAEIDYHTLTPWQLIDINQTIHQVLFDPLGMVIATSIFKKGSGGNPRTGDGDLRNYNVQSNGSFQDVLAQPNKYLQEATTFFYYNLSAWRQEKQPASYISLMRETHVSDLPVGESSKIRVSVGYSDGFGRVVEEKQLVEPGEAILWENNGNLQRDGNKQAVRGDVNDRWLVSGRTVYNNKGKVAEKYLPYFSNRALYESQEEIVQEKLVPPPTVFQYDPLLREIRIDTPKGFYSKVEFTPWEIKHYDENDTVKDSSYYKNFIANYPADPTEVQKNEKNALSKAAAFYNTPSMAVLDSLGRTFLEIQNNLGAVALDAFQAIVRGHITSEEVWEVLLQKGYMTKDDADTGWIADKFKPYSKGFKDAFIKELGDKYKQFAEDILNLLKQNCLTSYHRYDIQGREIESIDPRLYYANVTEGRNYYNFKYEYAMAAYGKTPVVTDSADAGRNVSLDNIFGNSVWNLSPRNFDQTIAYDRLQRKLRIRVKGIKNNGTVATDNIVETFVYGENQPQAEAYNLRGQLYKLQDQSGVIVNSQYSFQGELLETTRQLTQDYKDYIDWNGKVPLETPTYQTKFSFNALGQLLTETTPDSSVTKNTYNQGGLIQGVAVEFKGNSQSIINNIKYNANRQRTEVAYGSGVSTTYTYEDTTLRLSGLKSRRPGQDRQGHNRPTVIQDISYIYDPVGNITRMCDGSYKTVFYNNQAVKPLSDYTYDALYRLIQANGRQHPGINGNTYKNNEKDGDFKQSKFIPFSDSNALEKYRENYTYDDGGNLIKTTHAATNSWTRALEIMPDSNRLQRISSTQNGSSESSNVTYDRSGNQKQLGINNAVDLTWNCCENLVQVGVIERPSELDDRDYYNYDSNEMRTRKVSERMANGGAVNHRETKIYLGNYEEKWLHDVTASGETVILQRHTLRVMDQGTCVAIIHYWEKDDRQGEVDRPQTRSLRYQLDDRLGSVSLEVDGDANIISYEEYFPYGGTAFIAGKSQKEVKLKEYRYSGKERDDSTGLYYYGARYYAPWLGRWLSCDPAGTVDGLNLYAFVGGNPISYLDFKGYAKNKPTKAKDKSQKELTSPTAVIDEHHAIHLTVPLRQRMLKLDFSLQRHHYKYIADSHSEEMNSVIHTDINKETLEKEAIEIGGMLQKKSEESRYESYHYLKNKLSYLDDNPFALLYEPEHGWKDEQQRVESQNSITGNIPSLSGDYKVSSGRIYRVDNLNPQVQDPNHFYVIGGTDVAGNLSREEWLTIQAYRRVQSASRKDYQGAMNTTSHAYNQLRGDIQRLNQSKSFIDLVQQVSKHSRAFVKDLFDLKATQ